MCVCVLGRLVMSDSLRPYALEPPDSSVHGIPQARILGIFQTQGSNLALLHCRWILYHLSHQGSPILSNKPQIKQNFAGRKLQLVPLPSKTKKKCSLFPSVPLTRQHRDVWFKSLTWYFYSQHTKE